MSHFIPSVPFVRTTEPDYSTPIVDLGLLKQHARLPSDLEDDDALLTQFCATAERTIESQTEIALREQTWTLRLRSLPTEYECINPDYVTVRLEITPVTDVSVSFYDEDDTLVTLVEGTDYELITENVPPLLLLKIESIESLSDSKVFPITIEVTAGDNENIPPEASTAISLLVAHWYRFRESVGIAPGKEHSRVFEVYQDLLDTLAWRITV